MKPQVIPIVPAPHDHVNCDTDSPFQFPALVPEREARALAPCETHDLVEALQRLLDRVYVVDGDLRIRMDRRTLNHCRALVERHGGSSR